MLQPAPVGAKGRGLSASALKCIAILAMAVDHAAYAFLPDYWAPLALALHMVGRITGPVMFFFLAEGYHHTHDKNRYTLRLGVFALVSYVPFFRFYTGGWPTTGNWMPFSVIHTLFFGFLALRVLHEVKNPPLKVLLLVLCFLAAAPGDWGAMALAYILLFDVFRGSFARQALAYSCLTAIQMLGPLLSLVRLLAAGWSFAMVYSVFAQVLYYAAFFLPLLLLWFYNGQRGRASKWLFYVFYPAHLVAIVLVQMALG